MPALLMALVPLALLAGLAYGVIWLNKNLPIYACQAQVIMVQVRDGVRNGADKLVEPVLRLRSALASLEIIKKRNPK